MKQILFTALLTFFASSPSFSGEGSKPASTPHRPYSLVFIDELSSHHNQGIEMARLAAARAFHPELVQMAKKMIDDQSRDVAMLKAISMQYFPAFRSSPDRSIGMNMDKLSTLSGVEFDLAFLDSMIGHHPAAIYLGIEVQKRSVIKVLRELGKKNQEKQTEELNMMRTLRDAWAAHS